MKNLLAPNHLGYAMSGLGRSETSSQARFLQAIGLPPERIWRDEILREETYPRADYARQALNMREDLIDSLPRACILHVTGILSLGANDSDATWFVEHLQDAGATILIHEQVEVLYPHLDPYPLLKSFSKARHALAMRRSRARLVAP